MEDIAFKSEKYDFPLFISIQSVYPLSMLKNPDYIVISRSSIGQDAFYAVSIGKQKKHRYCLIKQ